MKRTFTPEYWMSPEVYGHDQKTIESLTSIGANKQADGDKRYSNAIKNMNRFGEFDKACDIELSETVVVLAAGPSLDAGLPAVRDAQAAGKISVVCADRAYERARKGGVRPDLILTEDPHQNCGMKFLRFVDSEDSVMCGVMGHPTFTVSPMLRKAGKTYLACGVTPFSGLYKTLFNELPREIFQYRVNYLVTFSAVDFAYWCGAKKIVTIGNDLCWKSRESFDNYIAGYKFNDIFFKAKWPEPDKLPEQMKGVDFYTTGTFAQAAAAFEFLPKTHPDCEWIDSSFGLVLGWQRKELAEAIN